MRHLAIWAAAVLLSGWLLAAIWHGPIAHGLSWGLVALACWMAARGVRRWSQAVPDGRGNWVAAADAPAEYCQRRSRTLWGLYASAVTSAAIAALPLLSD